MNTKTLCPICAEGHLNPQVEKNLVEYNGVSKELDLHLSICDGCGSETALSAQTRQNKRLMVAFKKEVDGLLTGREVRALREKLGINQTQAAQVFGGGPVAFSKYESDDVTQSEAMDKLLRLCLEVPGAFEHLAAKAGIDIAGGSAVWQVVTQTEKHNIYIVRHNESVYASSDYESSLRWA